MYILDKNDLEYKKIHPIKIIIPILLFVLISVLVVNYKPYKEILTILKIPIKSDQHDCTIKTIRGEFNKLNARHIDVILSQIIVESGNLESPIFKENNNFLGMKEAKTRPTTALGTYRNHAFYETWRDCVVDYTLWQSAYAKGLKEDEYIKYLSMYYAEDPEYGNKIRKTLKKVREGLYEK